MAIPTLSFRLTIAPPPVDLTGAAPHDLPPIPDVTLNFQCFHTCPCACAHGVPAPVPTAPVPGPARRCACACACPSTCVPVTLCHSLKSRPSRSVVAVLVAHGDRLLGLLCRRNTRLAPHRTPQGSESVGWAPCHAAAQAWLRGRRRWHQGPPRTGWLKLAKCHGFFW